jgi:hypothetical protein
MSMALEIANEIGAPPKLPASLVGLADRVRAMEAIEARVLGRVDHSSLARWRGSLSEAAGEMAADPNSVAGIADAGERKSILLRLWSGCMDAAKTIALETRAGPNSERDRTERAPVLDERSKHDPIYAAGVVAAPSFKAGRKERYSLKGVPPHSLVTSERVPEWEA